MFTKLLSLIFTLLLYSNTALADNDILAVQSARIAPYENALKGFTSVIRSRVKQYVFSDKNKTDIYEDIKKTDPSLILAIGRDALVSIKEVKNIPVIFIMVLNPQSMLSYSKNYYGICMNISPERQMDIFKKTIPGLTTIGLIYNPDNTGYLIENALKASAEMDINLITEKAFKSNEVPSAINRISDKIDAFWMIPDITLMTQEAIDLMLITSIEKKIPIFTFSEKYIEIGALLSVAVSPYDMGKQAGEKAQKILDGTDDPDEKKIFARKEVISINNKIAEKLGIDLNE